MPRILFFTALFALSNLAMARGQEPDAEPPLEVTLEIDGQKVDAVVGEEANVTIDGKARSVKLTAKPTRLIARAGVEFRYPSYFTYAYDDSNPGLEIYTLGSPTTTVMLQNYDASGVTADKAAAAVLGEMRRLYGDSLDDVAPSSITLGRIKVAGHRLRASFKSFEALNRFGV